MKKNNIKITVFMFLVVMFVAQPMRAMFLYNYFFKLKDNNSFTIQDKQEIEPHSMIITDFDNASMEDKKDLFSFLTDGKKMIYGFGKDFNDLDEESRNNYFNTKVSKYGCVNNRIVAICLCTKKESENPNTEHIIEMFSCAPLYRGELRDNVLKEYEGYKNLDIKIEKALSETKESCDIKTQLEFLRLSVKFSKE